MMNQSNDGLAGVLSDLLWARGAGRRHGLGERWGSCSFSLLISYRHPLAAADSRQRFVEGGPRAMRSALASLLAGPWLDCLQRQRSCWRSRGTRHSTAVGVEHHGG
jgi:hypothetical protein